MLSSSHAGATYILDIQTRKTYEDVGGKKGTSQMGVSYAALLNHNTDEITSYTEKNINRLLEEIFSSKLIVGFNLKKFVYEVLSGYRRSGFEKINSMVNHKINYKECEICRFCTYTTAKRCPNCKQT